MKAEINQNNDSQRPRRIHSTLISAEMALAAVKAHVSDAASPPAVDVHHTQLTGKCHAFDSNSWERSQLNAAVMRSLSLTGIDSIFKSSCSVDMRLSMEADIPRRSIAEAIAQGGDSTIADHLRLRRKTPRRTRRSPFSRNRTGSCVSNVASEPLALWPVAPQALHWRLQTGGI